jgi:sugar-specific transcriptional regulator TrmB
VDKTLLVENFSLTETEVGIYLSLLELGEATASEIATRNNLNRTFTYDRIDNLMKKGLVSYYVKDNKKYFKAGDPNQLVSLLKENEENLINSLRKKQDQIKEIIPDLLKLRSPKEKKPEVEIYSTKKGVKTVLNLILRSNEELFIYGAIQEFHNIMEHFYEIWNKQRIKNKIKTKVLTSDVVTLNGVEIDYLSEDNKTNTTTLTFGDKIIVILWSKVPIAILTKSQDLAKSNRSLFENLWNNEVKTYSGKSGVRRAYMELIAGDVKIFRGYGYSKKLADVYTSEFSNSWHNERLKRSIDNKIISYDDGESQNYFRPRAKKVEKFEVKYLDEDLQGPVCVTFSEKVVVTFIYTEKEFKVIINKNKETIDVHRKHFEKLWKKAKK